MNDINQTLAERGKRYGKFLTQACIAQDLKVTMRLTARWEDLAPDQKEALEMVANKIGRILNGDPSYIDSWHDIEGYVRLIVERLSISNSLTTTNGLASHPGGAAAALKPADPSPYVDRFLDRFATPEQVKASTPQAERDWLAQATQDASVASPSCEE